MGEYNLIGYGKTCEVKFVLDAPDRLEAVSQAVTKITRLKKYGIAQRFVLLDESHKAVPELKRALSLHD